MPSPSRPVRVVHVVAKTHLDLGFTALASEVEVAYLEEFFPRAIATAAGLRQRAGPERLVWTTGSWILHRALTDPVAARAQAVADAVVRGDLAWHALPVTTHTELMDVALVRAGLGIAAELDRRFERQTSAAKMTDVPGHTRGLVPLLAEAGVTFLHLGVNPAWPVPDVPPAFRWRAPDGTEVVVAYQAGGYGGEVVVEGCDEVLAFLHAGDNLGPPSLAEVVAAHRDLAERYPTASVRASTLDGFARALQASGAVSHLPVVTAEIGDPWIFGAGSDPQKVAAYRASLRRPDRTEDSDRRTLLVAEHTWGLDQKVALPAEPAWDDGALGALRSTEAGRRFEASWAEQRAYLRDPIDVRVPRQPSEPPDGRGRATTATWDVILDPATGALAAARHRPSGRPLADADHLIGLLAHQTFSAADYERFYAGLAPEPDDEWWARRDNTKPGVDRSGATSERCEAQLTASWTISGDDGSAALVARLALPDRVGAPPEAWARWGVPADDGPLTLELWWPAKPATRMPEATWLSFVPLVDEPERWELDKLGQRVSPLDVVRHGGRALHAVGEGMHHEGAAGRLTIRTLDAPLVAPGAPRLLDADPPLPDLAGGFHVLLHDNCWGTNFPMWSEGPARFRFELAVS